MGLRVANGPVSWGVDVPDKEDAPPWEMVFDEISLAGYRWCELGPVGYLPTDDALVSAALADRGLSVAGSHIYEPIHDPKQRHEVLEMTHRTCERIAGLGGEFVVVIDQVDERRGATAGRSQAATRLSDGEHADLVSGLRQIATVAAEHGLTPALHPHAGSHIEFDDEIERVLDATADDGLQLCIDTGHLAYVGIEPVEFFRRHRERIPYLHFKDIDEQVLDRVIADEVSFFDAIPAGVFCPIGSGMVDFGALAAELEGFEGPGTIEQDRAVDAATTAVDDARASLSFLREIGLTD